VATGDLALLSQTYNQSEAEAYGITAGAVTANVNLAIGLTNGSSYNLYIQNANIQARSINLDNHVAERSFARVAAGSVAIYGGALNVAVAEQNPNIQTYIGGSSSVIKTSGDLTLSSQFDSNSETLAVGVSVSLYVALGASVAVSKADATIDTGIKAGAITVGGDLLIWSRENTNADLSQVSGGAKAVSNASGGGAITGNGSVSYASNTPSLTAYTLSGASLLVNFGDINIKTIAYIKSDAEASGVTVGIVGVGVSVATAKSDGDSEAYLSSNVANTANTPGAVNINILSQTTDDAYAYTITGTGGVATGGGSVSNSYADSSSHAYIGSNRTVIFTGDISIQALETPISHAEAKGINVSGVLVGVSSATASASPETKAWIGDAVTLIGGTKTHRYPRVDLCGYQRRDHTGYQHQRP